MWRELPTLEIRFNNSYGVDMRKIIFYIFLLFSVLVGVYYSLACYALAKSDIEELLVYCLYPENNHFPPGLPQFYMLNFRGNGKDIALMKNRNGIGFILNAKSKSRDRVIKYASFFLEKGIDINMIGVDGFTALHVAILFNQPEDVSFLLNKGANSSIRVGYSRIYGKSDKTELYGMNAIELAKHLSRNDGQDRSKIIEMLGKP